MPATAVAIVELPFRLLMPPLPLAFGHFPKLSCVLLEEGTVVLVVSLLLVLIDAAFVAVVAAVAVDRRLR